ncbi:hypothetical protein FQR65_LT01928 [Abscondita terminalis]|nr:hypothetical protein FQR65_LT01928 [Abscondita terminalis]
MKLIVLLAVYFVAIHAKKVVINNSGYYWRDWDVNEPIPADAVVGGVSQKGHKTFIARTVYPKVGVLVPGKACEDDDKMWFEFDNLEHESVQDVSILCSLNHERFHWVTVKEGELVSNVEKGSKELIIAAHDRPKPIAIGKKTVGAVVHIGKVIVDPDTHKFVDMRISEDGKGWGVTDSYEVLVYDNQESNCDNVVVEFS